MAQEDQAETKAEAAPQGGGTDAASEQGENAAAAQEAPAGDPPAAVADAPERPDLSEVLGWVGHKLDELHGATVGRIEGAHVDAEDGKPEWLLVRFGRFGHHTLVPARDAVEGAGRVWVPFARDVIRRAPRIKAGSTLTKDEESALLAHYGVLAPAGRGADIAERNGNAVTARPAT
jgi:hypothetical protein